MLLVLLRALLLYTVVFLVMRFMGKRQVGQLQPFELAVMIMIAELAAIPMEDTEAPLLHGLVAIFALLLAQVTLSFATARSQRVRRYISGTPEVIIENGKIVEQKLRELNYSLDELTEQLRLGGIANIADVEFAIMETNGQLSIIPKSQARPIEPEDLGIETEYEGLPLSLIVDGRINEDDLKRAGLDRSWLETELRRRGIEDPQDVLYASLDTRGNLYYQLKSKAKPKAKTKGGNE